VDIIFDLPFYQNVGVTEDRLAFTDELIASINKTLDASQVLTITYAEGSIIATVVSLNDAFAADLHNLTSSGGLSVRGSSPSLCETYEYLDDADPNPFLPPNCVDLTECVQNQFEAIPSTYTSDRVCAAVTLCGREEYIEAEYTATTDRLCATDPPILTTPAASTRTLSSGLTVVVSLIAVFILVLLVAFIVWRQRKVTKDKRQNEFIERMKTSYNDDISEGNTLLRQLSLRDKSVLLFDNPVFSNGQQSSSRPEWFVGPMTRAEAVEHLNLRGAIIGDFVVRESSSNGAFVLSVRVEGDKFEHYKLAKDDQGAFTVDQQKTQIPLKTLDSLIDHLARVPDCTSVLLYLEDEYGTTDHNMTMKRQVANQPPSNDFYGSINPQQDSYGSIMNQRPAWLHGKLARGEAEAILAKDRTAGNFLIRESKAREGTYAISLVIDDGRVEHHSLRMKDGAFILNEKPMSAECLTLDQVVAHLGSYKEDMTRTLASDESSIPGMDGFVNPNFPRAYENVSTYSSLTPEAPRTIVSNPGYSDSFVDSSYDHIAVQDGPVDDAPSRPPKPQAYSNLPPKPDAYA
jgi:hypothetical protein